MQRRRFKQTSELSDRLVAEATRLRDLAMQAGSSVERELLLDRARQYDEAKHMEGWLRSSELWPPS